MSVQGLAAKMVLDPEAAAIDGHLPDDASHRLEKDGRNKIAQPRFLDRAEHGHPVKPGYYMRGGNQLCCAAPYFVFLIRQAVYIGSGLS
jgi:hypothetical protein